MGLSDVAFNRALNDEPWAREQLAAHAGRVFHISVAPIRIAFRITGDGHVERAAGATPDLTLSLSPFGVPAFLADPSRWDALVTEDGDVALGGTLKALAQTLPWFVERLFSRTLGPIAGQRVADAGRRMLAMPEYAATRVTENIGSYARDEIQVLAHPADLRTLADEQASLESRLDTLVARIEGIAARVAGAGPREAGIDGQHESTRKADTPPHA
jgi:ubiquinone biosynthesis protein UbiJ